MRKQMFVVLALAAFATNALAAPAAKKAPAKSAPAASAPAAPARTAPAPPYTNTKPSNDSWNSAGSAGKPVADIGLLFGFMKPSTSSSTSTSGTSVFTDGRLGLGLTFNYWLNPEWTVGGFFMTGSKGVTVGNAETKASYTPFGVQGGYHYNDFTFGARLGLTSTSITQSVGSLSGLGSSSDFTFGPMVAYDYMLSPEFSVGGDLSYLIITSTNSAQLLNIAASFKYHFF